MAQRLNVIPYPTSVSYLGPESYTLSRAPITIQCVGNDESLLQKAKHLQHGLEQRFSTQSTICDTSSGQHTPASAITLLVVEQLQQLDQFRWSQESYELTCGPQGINITALTPTGVFYGIQTLLQALQSTAEGLAMPYIQIVDGPRFVWRGVLLDVGRHFFPVPFILKLLDLMALYKMNRFHWHLTEDQGWRLDVPALPLLSEVGAWRGTPTAAAAAASNSSSSTTTTASQPDSSQQTHTPQQQQQQQQQGQQQGQQGADPASSDPQQQQPAAAAAAAAASICGRALPSAAAYHGGFYSMADVSAVVAYAAERCIEVVPEVELPGHCCAALAAYPHLSCTGDVPAVSTHWGIHEDVYCAGSEDVFSFLGVVLDQVVSQFPCAYVHIGGDEVPKGRWEECERCQARMRQEGLCSAGELQSWFVRRVSKMLAARGRRLIGWDEILEGGLAEGATVMSWRGTVGGIIAAKSGHDVIMTPTSHCYFDYKQAHSACEPGAWYACLPLHVVYHYDPIPGPWPEQTAAAAAAPAAAAAGDGGTAAAGGGGGESSMSGDGDDSSSPMSHDQPSRSEGVADGEDADSAAAAAAAGAGSAGGGISAAAAGGCRCEEDAVMEEQEVAAAAARASGEIGGSSSSSIAARAAAGDPPATPTPAAAAGDGTYCPIPLQQQLGSSSREAPPTPHLAAAAAAVDASAAAAAGPHFPGDPPGVGLASHPVAAAAAAAAAAPAAAAAAAAPEPGSSSSSSKAGVLSEQEVLRVLGSQANLWCEYVQDEETAEYMLLPRLAALAEAVWTPVSLKDWDFFTARLADHHLPLLQQMGYKYRPLT